MSARKGAWSKVRSLLSEAEPEYVGTSFIETYLYDADERHPAAAEAVGGGALFALAPERGSSRTVRRPAPVPRAEPSAEWIAGIDFADIAAAVARVAAEFDGWAPELSAPITDGETAPIPRMIHALPVGHRWDRVPGVTLLGDAAHPMPPSAERANLAMFDGAALATAFAAHPDGVDAALTACEETLFPRSSAEAAAAHRILELCLDDRAAFGLVDFFTGATAGRQAKP